MPDINDHMDELFRKASENYPLKTTAGNFDDLMPYLAGPAALTGSAKSAVMKRRYTALLLSLLLIGGGTATYVMLNHSNQPKTNNVATEQVNTKQAGKTKILSYTQTTGNSSDVSQSSTATNLQQPIKETDNLFPFNKVTGNNNARLKVKITFGSVSDMYDYRQTGAGGLISPENKKTLTNLQRLKIIISNNGIENMAEPEKENKKQDADKNTSSNSDKKKRAKPNTYFGISAGVALNQVKGQHSTKPGLTAGLILGLQLNKKLSVETGVQLTQKKYYTQGKYFTPKAGTMPADMKITSLNGTSTLIEMPVSIKYNFSKKKNGFYGMAGVSTYVMTKESNEYKAFVSGQQQDINSTYNNTHYYPAAQLNIGAGYRQTLGKKINIRVEPYIQIPLQGMGIGSLPVTSTGVHLILIRN